MVLLKCPSCENGMYITGLCEGNPSFDTGKFHNHLHRMRQFLVYAFTTIAIVTAHIVESIIFVA
jgi:hypothetical protein